MTTTNTPEPSDDDIRGMAWWNNLSPSARNYWLEQASLGGRIWDISAKDAWEAYKATKECRWPNCDCEPTCDIDPKNT